MFSAYQGNQHGIWLHHLVGHLPDCQSVLHSYGSGGVCSGQCARGESAEVEGCLIDWITDWLLYFYVFIDIISGCRSCGNTKIR